MGQEHINAKLDAPWYSYQKKIAKLFEHDNKIKVDPVKLITDEAGEPDHYRFKIHVYGHLKAEALKLLLIDSVTFGNVRLVIDIVDHEENIDENNLPAIYGELFKGNDILRDIKTFTDAAGVEHTYVRFNPRVVQFMDDDISDYNGNWSGLPAEIAREVLEEKVGSNFCTAPIDTPDAYKCLCNMKAPDKCISPYRN